MGQTRLSLKKSKLTTPAHQISQQLYLPFLFTGKKKILRLLNQTTSFLFNLGPV